MSIEKGPGGVTPLMHAIFLNDPAKVSHLLGKSNESIDAVDDQGMTALHYAALSGYSGIVAILLDAGANPHSKDKDENTPLRLAIKRGHVEVVVMLEDAEKKAPPIRPEELPARVVELERIVGELRQQIAEMTKKKTRTKTPKPLKKNPS